MLPVAELHLHIEGTLEPELLARNSFDACFAPVDAIDRWKAEVDAWLAARS